MSNLPEQPISRMEQYLSNIAGEETTLPETPISRVEQYLDYIIENGTAQERAIAAQVQSILAALPNKANLVGGKVPSSELPSYIDEATEGYYYDGAFYEDEAHTTPITPSGSIIYVDIPTRRTYRWTGTGYLMIDDENALYVVPVVNMTTMGELRAYIDGINEQGLHVLLDFSNYIGDAFVCTVHLFDEGGVHYCEMLDAVNIQSVVKASYVDTDTIADFVTAGKSKLVTMADVDAAPTQGSVNPVMSGGVYDAFARGLPIDLLWKGGPAAAPLVLEFEKSYDFYFILLSRSESTLTLNLHVFVKSGHQFYQVYFIGSSRYSVEGTSTENSIRITAGYPMEIYGIKANITDLTGADVV